MIASVAHTAESVTVTMQGGAEHNYPAIWLRDNIPSGRHRAEGQRTFDINVMVGEPTIDSAQLVAGDLDVVFGPDGTTDTFPGVWLAAHPLDAPGDGVIPPPRLWGREQQAAVSFADYQTVVEDAGARLDWLRHLRDFGFALLAGTPVAERTVLQAVDLFGFVRETNYGRLFDVIVEPDPANLANTSGHIGMHTDNPYRDPVPGLQLLHCIINDTEGGESQLLDGFAAAEGLRADDPEAFEILATSPVRFRYLEEGVADLQSYRPLIDVDPRGWVTGLRYNSRSAAPFDMAAADLPSFYRAYRALADRLNDPDALIEFKLGPGDLMIFDNQRVLHGRSAYRQGRRHLQGCYADKDSLHSTIRILEVRRGDS